MEDEPELLRPIHTNTFALPLDAGLRIAYAVYNPPREPLILASEKGRTVFAEAFIEHPNLGTLADLCLRVIAQTFGASQQPGIACTPIQERLQIDAIDVEQPLEDIYEIEDVKFWRRLVLAKTKDPALKLKKEDDHNWRSEGISLKYVELVEDCPAEFWPEAKMSELAMKINPYVKEMHIRKLQSLQDFSFQRYMRRDSETDGTTSTDVSSTTYDYNPDGYVSLEEATVLSSDKISNVDDRRAMISQHLPSQTSSIGGVSLPTRQGTEDENSGGSDNDDQKDLERFNEKMRKKTEERRVERRIRREEQIKRRELREEKRLQREEVLNKPKPKKIKVRDVFNLPVDEVPDEESKKLDRRNLEKYMAHLKSYKYPDNHCHHIDLRFLQYFENLVSFQIEFNPPELQSKYHKRHFKFSYQDVQNLSNGISQLQNLRIFRLRDSRMDEPKLFTLAKCLSQLNVEVIDFGNDQLKDDCEDAFAELFLNNTSIRSLELEGNFFGPCVLKRLGKILKRYEGRLVYLGLAGNPLDTEAMHALCSKIARTPQIESICLASVRFSEMTMFCCIADELLNRHKALRSLDLMCAQISGRGAEHLLKAMNNNQTLEHLECRGCNFDFDLELDLELALYRNRYLGQNAYIGKEAATKEEIMESVNKVKNPILLKVNETIEKRQLCLEARPDIAERFSLESFISKEDTSYYESMSEAPQQTVNTSDNEKKEDSLKEPKEPPKPFVYNANQFNFEEFHQHVLIPGPGQRYRSLRAKDRSRCAYEDESFL